MRVNTFLFSVAFCGALMPALVAQAPLLQLSAPQSTAMGWQVTVKNLYNQPATAFVLSMTSPERALPGGLPLARETEDAIPGRGGTQLGIAAGASKTVRLGGRRFTSVAYQIEAVIYADGRSAGQPSVVARLLQVRRAELDDINAVLPALQRAQADPQLAADIPGVVQEFRARADAHAKSLSGASGALRLHTGDYVCDLVWTNLNRPTPGVPPSTELAVIESVLTQWRSLLAASKPDLAALTGPDLLQ
jgi:hypothetical protein